jgi:hypothetical protein
VVTKKRNSPKLLEATPSPTTQAELKKHIRSQSYTDALMCVEWLNGVRGTAAYSRALRVREEMEGLTEMRDALRGRVEEIAAFEQRCDALNQLLSRYTYIPAIGYSALFARWRFDMVPKTRPKFGRKSLSFTITDGLVAFGRGPATPAVEGESVSFVVSEPDVVAALGRLANHRELYKVRLCEQCGERWRLSERAIDKFCSIACREAFYRRDPEFLAKKAQNQQNYRKRMKRIP